MLEAQRQFVGMCCIETEFDMTLMPIMQDTAYAFQNGYTLRFDEISGIYDAFLEREKIPIETSLTLLKFVYIFIFWKEFYTLFYLYKGIRTNISII